MADERLAPDRRVRKRRDFLRIQSSSRKVRSKHIILSISSSSEQSRIGITVTTKVEKRAVGRNKFKRFVREVFRKQRNSLMENVDLVVIALAGATKLDYSQLREEFIGALIRSRLLSSSR